MPERLRVLLIFGGGSPGRKDSIASARNAYAALDDNKYDASLCHIDKNGQWYLIDDIEMLDTKNSVALLQGERHIVLEVGGKPIVPDAVLSTVRSIENQILISQLGFPVVGADLLGRLLVANTDMCKRLLRAAKLPLVDYRVFTSKESIDFAHITLQLGSPVILRTVGYKSRIIHDASQFATAIAKVDRRTTAKIVFEQVLEGRELHCGVIGNSALECSPVAESKMTDGATELSVPAEVEDEIAKKISDYALAVYEILGLRGLAQVNFLLQKTGDIYVSEVITTPNLTTTHVFPRLWREAGLTYAELVDKVIELARE